MIVGHVGDLGFRPMNLNAAQPADYPIGGLGIRQAEPIDGHRGFFSNRC
jgi:hypothetical protein